MSALGYFRLRASFNIPSVSAGVVGVVIGRSLGGGGGGGGGITFRYKAVSSIIKDDAELMSCVKVEVAVLGSPSLIVRTFSVDVNTEHEIESTAYRIN